MLIPEFSISKELSDNFPISVYPNPAADKLHISSLAKIDVINIFDITGRQVFTKKFITNDIDISKYKNGVYLFEIIIGQKKYLQRIIISR
jgi:hypothetical protein